MRDCMQIDAIRRMLSVDHAMCVLGGSGDKTTDESYKCLYLISVESSSVVLFLILCLFF